MPPDLPIVPGYETGVGRLRLSYRHLGPRKLKDRKEKEKTMKRTLGSITQLDFQTPGGGDMVLYDLNAYLLGG
jgi:hypothetical protein